MSARLAFAAQPNAAFQTKATRAALLAVVAFAGLQTQVNAQVAVDLGSAASFAILAGSAITFTLSPNTITGNIGSDPTPTVNNPGNESFVTGSNLSSTGIMPTAKSDLASAYSAITGQSTNRGATAFSNGLTLTSGVYAITSTTTDITGTLTLSGSSSDIFIFKMSDTLITGSGSQILLTGGVQASNVYWQVFSSATLGGGSSVFEGSILALDSITVGSGVNIDGRLLAQSAAVTLAGSDVVAVPTAIAEPATSAFIAAAGAFGLACWRRRCVAS